MKCPQCNYENRPEARFCHQCGKRLTTPSAAARNDSEGPDAAQAALPPLPEGALIGDRYIVRNVQETNDHRNQYIAEDMEAVRLCPNCNTVTDNPDEEFCVECGADIAEAPATHMRYRLDETLHPQAFASELRLLRMRLEHPAIQLPLTIFSEAPYGPERHYRLLPEFSIPTAVSMSVPQELNDVLQWGSDLAAAMAHLHTHQVVLKTPQLDHVVLEDRRAYWIDLNQASVISPEARGRVHNLLAQDVKGLATLCLYLATGQRQLDPDVTLPDDVDTLLRQALGGHVMAQEFSQRLEAELQRLRRPSSVTLIVGQKTDVGQVRTLNEDSLLTVQTTPIYRSKSRPTGVFVVADGMGGHDAGDVASQLTCKVIGKGALADLMPAATQATSLPDPSSWLEEITRSANQAVYEQRQAAHSDMGTTLTMALVRGDTATIANVGDSRAYHLTPESITQITTDHSLVERLVAAGQITQAEAADHPQKNVIYRVMGDRAKVEVDIFGQKLDAGEGLLLCSDGLSGMISDDEIWHIWQTSYSPQEACDRLVKEANRAGGEDNVTVIIVQAAHY